MEVKEEKNGWSKFWKGFISLPKLLKYGILALIIITLTSTGIMFGTVLNSQTKTTKIGLEDVGELVTQTAHVVVVKDTEKHRDFFNLFKLPFTESRQIFSYDVDVDASVDFENIKYKIDDKEKEITVKLPHADIYKTTLDTDSLKIYLDEESVFSNIDLKEQNDALKEIKKQAEKDAKTSGLLEAADKNAKLIIESFLKSDKKYENYVMIYKYIGD